MSTLEMRILKMEKQLRFYRLIFLVIILTGGFIVVTSFNEKDQVQTLVKAKEFQVVDETGKVLISLKKDYGAGNIRMNNENGGNIIHMLNSDDGTGAIVTKTRNGNFACRMIDYENGAGGMFEVYNKDGKVVTELGSVKNGGGYIGIKNKDNISVGEMGATDRNTGYMLVNNSTGNYLFRVTYTESTYGGWMGLYNNSGKNVVQVSTSGYGGDVTVRDNNVKEMINLGITSGNDGVLSAYNRSSYRILTLGGDANGNGALNVLNSYGQNMNGVWPKQ